MKSALKFVDGSSLLSGNPLCRSSSVCLFDIDGDDEPEIIISNTNFKNLVYKYSEEKKCFVPISISALECARKKTVCITVGDFLGNGCPSFYVQHSEIEGGLKKEEDHLFVRRNPLDAFTEMNDLFINFSNLSNPYAGKSVGALDLSGSGRHGFYVVNTGSPSLFYQYNPRKKSLEEVSEKLGIRQFASGQSILGQYVNHEKCLDIFIGNKVQSNSFFTKVTKTKYKNNVSKYELEDDFFETTGIAVADFDGNGKTDIVVGNWIGINSIFIQDPLGNFKNLAPALFSEPMPIRNVIVADFDNDGFDEIFINNYDEDNKMLRYLGNNEWEELEIGDLKCSDLYCTGASVGDLTGNGFLDLVITTGERQDQKNKLFLGVSNGNFWMRIQPLTQNGFPALGAKVRLFCRNFRDQTKFICSGSGNLCQMEPVAHFGLGCSYPEIEKIEIVWPGNGVDAPARRIISGSMLKVNSFMKIPYPSP